MRRVYSLPLRYQVQDVLEERIESGEYKAGDKIPSERALALEFDVSRMTVRNAVEQLISDGLLKRDSTRGTVVASPKISRNTVALSGLSQILREQGIDVTTRLMDFEVIPAPTRVARKLNIISNAFVNCIKRVRYVGDEPVIYECVYIPHSLAPLTQEDVRDSTSLYELLGRKYGIRPVRASQTIELIRANDIEAEYLDVPVREPLLLLEGLAYSDTDIPIEFARSVSRGDRCRIHSEISRLRPGVDTGKTEILGGN